MQKLLVIGAVWPEPQTTAAGVHMMQLLKAFQQEGFDIMFTSIATNTPYSVDLREHAIQTKCITLNDPSFDILIKELQPDIVLFDRFMTEEQFGWRVTENAPEALRILNTEDLHSLRETRAMLSKKQLPFDLDAWLAGKKTLRELASIYRSDLTLVLSTYEMGLLEQRIGIPSAYVSHCPFLIPERGATNIPSLGFHGRKDFVTFGNGRHLPNTDALHYLKDALWPMIRKLLPGANLHVYGAYLPQSIQNMHDDAQGFLVKGWIADLEAVVSASKVVLAPLRFGAGIKGKLALAMQCGTPSVTTPIGAEGLVDKESWSGQIGNTPEALGAAAVALYQSESQWISAQQRGFEILADRFPEKEIQKRLFHQIRTIQQNLRTHRLANTIGRILQQEAYASTKFMGRWIEEKNRENKG